jgi:hypothetical protein
LKTNKETNIYFMILEHLEEYPLEPVVSIYHHTIELAHIALQL